MSEFTSTEQLDVTRSNLNRIIGAIFSYLIMVSIFISGDGIAEVGFTFYWYYIIYIPFFLFGLMAYRKFDWNVFLILCLIAVYSLLTFQYDLSRVIKQLVNISFSIAVFYFLLAFEKFDYQKIIRKYIAVCKIVLIIGFIQVALYALDAAGFGTGKYFLAVFQFLKTSHISYRFQSITQEPSYLAYVFAPVAFLSLYGILTNEYFIVNRKWGFLFILAYLLTFSLVAYVGLICMVLVIFFRSITPAKIYGSVIVLAFLYLFAYFSYKKIELIKIRVDETLSALKDGIIEDENYKKVNFSSYAILTNWHVTQESINDHPLTGNGLGSYELLYDKHLPDELKEYATINREDANSMAFRMLAEIGFIGFGAFFIFLLRFRIGYSINYSVDERFLWVFNNGILIMVLLFLMRNGNYTMHGRLFFILLLYYTYQAVKKQSSSARII